MKSFFPLLSPLLLGLIALTPRAALIDDMLKARDYSRAGQLDRVAELTSRTDGTALEMYPRYWIISAQIDEMPESELNFFLDHYAGSYLAERLRGEWLKSLGKRGQWSLFEREWPKLINWESGSELHCYRLQFALQRNDTKLVVREGRPLWFTARGLNEACIPVFDALFANGTLQQDDVWQRIRLVLEANNPDFAAQLAARIGSAGGIDRKRLQAVASNPAKAINNLSLNSRGGRELALFAISRAGRTSADTGRALLEKVASQLPDTDRRYAWSRLGYHAARQLRDEALDYYQRGQNLQQLDDESRDWYVRTALRTGNWTGVANGIDAMSAEKQRDPAWQYWRARAFAQTNQIPEANRRYVELAGQHNFYGLLAREEIGPMAEPSRTVYKPSSADLQAIRQLPSVERALALNNLEWRNEAIREWNWGMRGLNDNQLLAAAEVARQTQWYDRAIYSAERTKDLHDFSLRFLAPYRETTQVYARQIDLDEAWIYGLIRQESRFISVAKSGAGAQGLMQLMPATASWVAKKIGMRNYSPAAVNEIGTNVQLGTYYLKHVLDSLGDQPVLATAAYNAGPGRARVWRASRPLEGAIYAESIPFAETRDYVKKVMANAIYYSQAFGQGETSLKRRLGIVPGRSGNDVPLDDTP
ncbi:transglycosylase SLT domain-containing protein [Chitinimonas sp. PSY-7]|uniref:transglycosylase SLT domain-containing protein n=1 Tax=Chitinimonas sp. PSY-7 TaxID=3459088 RepID=UPI00403FE74D